MPYTGVVADIPCGLGGLMTDRNQDAIPITHLIAARSVVIERGAWRKLPGAVQFGSAIVGAPSIRTLLDWWPTATLQRLLTYAADGKVYKDDGAGDLDAVTLVSGLSTTARGHFVTGGAETVSAARKAFLFTGADQPQVLAGDGITMTAISAPPVDWTTKRPVKGIIHRGRLWGLAGHRTYASSPTNHEDFTTTPLQFAVFPGVGEELVAAAVFQGTLYLGKYPVGLFWLDDSDIDTANWAIRPLSTAIGCVKSPVSMLPIVDDVLILAADGRFHLLSAVRETAGVGVGTSDISGALGIQTFLTDTVALGSLAQLTAAWYGHKQTVLAGLPAFGGTANTVTLLLDYAGRERQEPVKPTWSDRDRVEALALRKDTDGIERPVFGDEAGRVWRLDQVTRSKGGAAYVGEYQIPHTDFGYVDPTLASRRKNFDALEFVVIPTGQWNLSVDTILDGQYQQTVLYDMGITGATLGSFVIGTSALAGDQVQSRRKRIGGNGRRFSYVARNGGVAEDFAVTSARVSFRPAGEEEGR